MDYRIIGLPEKKLVGMRMKMSLAENKNAALWQSFMPRLKELNNTIGTELYDLQLYDEHLHFGQFNQHTIFEKWVAKEVAAFDHIPPGMESYILESGLYAVFIHKGTASTFYKTTQYIFGTWLPASEFLLDSRAHFEVLGEKYKLNDPASEEEIWIPIKAR